MYYVKIYNIFMRKYYTQFFLPQQVIFLNLSLYYISAIVQYTLARVCGVLSLCLDYLVIVLASWRLLCKLSDHFFFENEPHILLYFSRYFKIYKEIYQQFVSLVNYLINKINFVLLQQKMIKTKVDLVIKYMFLRSTLFLCGSKYMIWFITLPIFQKWWL